MIPSSPTSLLHISQLSTRETLRHIRNAGFTHVDFNFTDLQHADTNSPFVGEEWKTWARDTIACAYDLGLTITQAHGPVKLPSYSDDYWNMLKERAFIMCEMGKIPGMVFHPIGYGITERGKFEEVNLQYYEQLRDEAKSYGVDILLENMTKGFQSTEDDLLFYINALGSGTGICWDLGHAFLAGIDQPAAFKKMGQHLKGLHVHDTINEKDTHIAPFFGHMNWPEIMRGLRDANYDGDFTFEVFNFHRKLPAELLDEGLRLLYAIANYLLTL